MTDFLSLLQIPNVERERLLFLLRLEVSILIKGASTKTYVTLTGF